MTNVASSDSPRRSREAELVGGQREHDPPGGVPPARRRARRCGPTSRPALTAQPLRVALGASRPPGADELEVALLEAAPPVRSSMRSSAVRRAQRGERRDDAPASGGDAVDPIAPGRIPRPRRRRRSPGRPRPPGGALARAARVRLVETRCASAESQRAAPRRRSARPACPAATSRPRSSTATRSARRSTSASSWVVSRIVVALAPQLVEQLARRLPWRPGPCRRSARRG